MPSICFNESLLHLFGFEDLAFGSKRVSHRTEHSGVNLRDLTSCPDSYFPESQETIVRTYGHKEPAKQSIPDCDLGSKHNTFVKQ